MKNWSRSIAIAIKFENISQGYKATNTPGTNTVFFPDHDDIKNIPTDRKITYAHVIVEYRPQKPDPNRVRITVGGNINQISTWSYITAVDLVTAKILRNSAVMTLKNTCVLMWQAFTYTSMECFKNMCMPIKLIPQSFIDEYDLRCKSKNGFVSWKLAHMDYHRLASWQTNCLAKFAYYKVPNKPGLWKY